MAITSVTFQSCGPGLPIAAYSPGIFSGFTRLGDVAVDARVVGHVVLELDAGGAVDLVGEVVLALEVLLAVGRELPLRVVLGAVARGAAGEGGQLGPAGVAEASITNRRSSAPA